jgi:hypothetical protein
LDKDQITKTGCKNEIKETLEFRNISNASLEQETKPEFNCDIPKILPQIPYSKIKRKLLKQKHLKNLREKDSNNFEVKFKFNEYSQQIEERYSSRSTSKD